MEFDPDKCKWLFMGNDEDTPDLNEPFCVMIADFMKDRDAWRGTATELSEALNGIDPDCGVNHLNITKKLNANTGLFKERYALVIDTKGHDGKRREIIITRREQDEE